MIIYLIFNGNSAVKATPAGINEEYKFKVATVNRWRQCNFKNANRSTTTKEEEKKQTKKNARGAVGNSML